MVIIRHRLAAAMVLMGLLNATLPVAAQSPRPFQDAVAVWHMNNLEGTGKANSRLVPKGAVEVGVPLQDAAREASWARSGDGYVARFRNGYLTTDSSTPIRLSGKHASICLRLRDSSQHWNSILMATADPLDRLANLFFADGRDLCYRWRTTPPWERVEGIPKPSDEVGWGAEKGSYGFNGESNDAHDLLSYTPCSWVCSVIRVYDDGRIIVMDKDHRAEGKIEIDCQNVGDEAFFIGSKAGVTEFLDGDIAEILVYERALTDEESRDVIFSLLSKWNLIETRESGQAALPGDGLALQLDASRSEADDSGRVKSWTDCSGNGHDMRQAIAARMPTRVTDAQTGNSVIRFRQSQFLQGPPVLAAGDDSFTIIGLWRRDHLDGSQVICEQNAAEKLRGRRAALLVQGSAASPASGWMRNRNFADGVLPISVPIDWFGKDGWHDVVVRFADTVVELYVDGVLIDEEWPHGALHRFCSPFLLGAGYAADGQLVSSFNGEIDHVAIWDRALSLEEIVALSGGRQHVAQRDLEILGEPQKSIQYWKPPGKAYAGDCMVTCREGVFHVFYLYDRLHHAAKWGLGAHQYGHLSSSDLKQWTHHPLAVPIDRQWECAMGTGNVIFNEKDRRWYAFYTDCGSRIQFFDKPQRGAWLFRSVSDDGIHFTKDFKPVLPGFDSDIFFVPETGQFHLIAEGGRTHYQSEDLQQWTSVADSEFRKTAERDDVSRICPDTLAWNDWYYFTTGSSRIYKSRHPLGPWEEIPKDVFDGLFFSKMHAYKDGRALAAGWVAYPGWGGHIVLRELVQHPNGDLGLKFVPELMPETADSIRPEIAGGRGTVAGDTEELHVGGAPGLNFACFDVAPHNVRIRLTVRPGPDASAFGICLRGEGDYASGNELRFEPETGRIQWGHPLEGTLAAPAPERLLMDGDIGALAESVQGLDKPFTLDIILKDRIVDVCIDNRRTFIASRPEDSGPGGRRLFLFSQDGAVVFESLKVCPLVP